MSTCSLDAAVTMVSAALKYARDHRYPPMGVVVIDHTGNPKAAMREDGANLVSIDIAQGKARAALVFGCTSRQIADAFQDNPLAGASVVDVLQGRLVMLAGGVLLKSHSGNTIGAIGVAGGAPNDDEAVALAGAAAI